MPIKAVLFDHDGTLVDSEAIHYDLWQELLARFDINIPLSEFEAKFVGLPSAAIAAHIARDYNIPLTAEALFIEKSSLVKDYLAEKAFPLIDDALDVIQALKAAGVILAVVTGAPKLNIESTIRYYDLAKYFDSVVCGYDVENNKPAPDPYQLAMTQLGLTADECVAVEDSETGLLSAHRAGLRCLTVESALTPHHNLEHSFKHCKNLTEVKHWVLETSG